MEEPKKTLTKVSTHIWDLKLCSLVKKVLEELFSPIPSKFKNLNGTKLNYQLTIMMFSVKEMPEDYKKSKEDKLNTLKTPTVNVLDTIIILLMSDLTWISIQSWKMKMPL